MRARERVIRSRGPQLHPQLEPVHLFPARIPQPVLEPMQRLRILEPPATRILRGPLPGLASGAFGLVDGVNHADGVRASAFGPTYDRVSRAEGRGSKGERIVEYQHIFLVAGQVDVQGEGVANAA